MQGIVPETVSTGLLMNRNNLNDEIEATDLQAAAQCRRQAQRQCAVRQLRQHPRTRIFRRSLCG